MLKSTGGFHSDFFTEFCRLGSNRQELIKDFLNSREIPFKLLKTAKDQHFLIPLKNPSKKNREESKKQSPRISSKGIPPKKIMLIAHYDRVEGTPGANDNSASVFHLLSFAAESLKGSGYDNLHILLTDHEELGPLDSPQDQGSARMASRLLSPHDFIFFVFDMCGIGNTFAINTSTEHRLGKISGRHAPKIKLFSELQEIRKITANILLSADLPYIYLPGLFSDDLGLLTQGIPAVQISLVPESCRTNLPFPEIPEVWKNHHTAQDLPETLEEKTLVIMRIFLLNIAGKTG